MHFDWSNVPEERNVNQIQTHIEIAKLLIFTGNKNKIKLSRTFKRNLIYLVQKERDNQTDSNNSW